MSKLLCTSRFAYLRRRTFSAIVTSKSLLSFRLTPSLSSLPFFLYAPLSNPQPFLHSLLDSYRRRNLCIRAFDSSSVTKKDESSAEKWKLEKEFKSSEAKTDSGKSKSDNGSVGSSEEEYPSGEFEFKEFGAWKKFLVKLRMLIAFPWERIPKGSVLTMKLRGQISDQLKSPFSSRLSLPQICENFIKAAYDPRISGIYLHIERLSCGWGKVEEIRRHILDFKKSGKFIIGYVPACGERVLSCLCL